MTSRYLNKIIVGDLYIRNGGISIRPTRMCFSSFYNSHFKSLEKNNKMEVF